MRQENMNKRRGIVSRGIVIRNAHAHTSASTQKIIATFCWEQFDQKLSPFCSKQEPSDTDMRTGKLKVHTACRAYGAKVHISSPDDSDYQQYRQGHHSSVVSSMIVFIRSIRYTYR
jgi:hypothetical protein